MTRSTTVITPEWRRRMLGQVPPALVLLVISLFVMSHGWLRDLVITLTVLIIASGVIVSATIAKGPRSR